MEKMKKIFIVFVLAFFMFLGNVDAEEENTCRPAQLSELRSMAANVKVTYIPVSVVMQLDEPDGEGGQTETTREFLDIKIYNINSKLIVNVEGNDLQYTLGSNDVGADGSITLRQATSSKMITYDFEIFSNEYGCYDQTLRTIKLTLPKFNSYAQLSACADIPDYYLCQRYTTYDVDGSTFYTKVDEYKAKLLTLEEAGDIEIDNNGVISDAISTVSEYKYIIVGVVVVIGVVLTIIITKRKRSAL